MSTISFQDIQSDPTALLRRVEAGEAFLVVRGGRALAEVKPIPTIDTLRPYSLAAGQFRVPDDFDGPLPDDVLEDFEGR